MSEREEMRLVPEATEYQQAFARPGRSGFSRPEALVIGERIRAARFAARLTQQELAGGQYSKSYISAVERGKMVPSIQALAALAERLSVPVSYLLGESEITQAALEESREVLGASPEEARQADEIGAMLRLGNAEDFIRKEQPQEALEQLGGSDEPPAALPLIQRPQWYWLAGWAVALEGRNADAVRLLERGFHLAESLHLRAPPSQRARLAEQVERLRCYLGVAHCSNGQTDLALQYHLQGLEAIDKHVITDAGLKLMIYKGLGREYLALGRYAEAITYYQLALQHAKDRGDPRQHALAAWGLGMAYGRQDDLLHARESYQEALEAAGRHGNRRTLAQIRALLGQVLTNLKDYEEAERHLRYSVEGAKQAGDPKTAGVALGNLAALYIARGEPEQAVQVAQEALRLAQEQGDQRSAGQLQYTLAAAYDAMQQGEAAEWAFQEALRIARQISDLDVLGQAQQRYADFLARQGRFQEAYAAMQRVPAAAPGEQRPSKSAGLESDIAAEFG